MQKNDGCESSTGELSGLVECDPVLFKRLIWHLGTTNILRVDKNGLYQMAPFTTGLVKEDLSSMVDYFIQVGIPTSLHLSKFLKDIKYQNPPGNENDCFKHYSSGQSIWEYLAAIQRLPRTLVGIQRQPGASEETSLRSTPAKVSVVEKMNPWLLMSAEVLDTTFKRSRPGIQAQRDDWCFKKSGHSSRLSSGAKALGNHVLAPHSSLANFHP